MWTVDGLGWKPDVTADQVFNRIIARATNGMIILMHVGSESGDADALEPVIRWFRDRGYAFGTITQITA